jgi:Xaa-Pro aminopeptidase
VSITAQEYTRRRRELMAQMAPNSIAIVPAAPERKRNRDIEYPYRQDSDLHYLCGFPEPEAVLVLVPGRAHGEVVMFVRERDRGRGNMERLSRRPGRRLLAIRRRRRLSGGRYRRNPAGAD